MELVRETVFLVYGYQVEPAESYTTSYDLFFVSEVPRVIVASKRVVRRITKYALPAVAIRAGQS